MVAPTLEFVFSRRAGARLPPPLERKNLLFGGSKPPPYNILFEYSARAIETRFMLLFAFGFGFHLDKST